MSIYRFSYLPAAIAAFLLLVCYACGGKSNPNAPAEIVLDYNAPVIQQIISLRGKYNPNGVANTDALKTYLNSDKPAQRLMTAIVLTAVQDSNLVPDLEKTLKDAYPQVRAAAATALGFCKTPRAAQILCDAFKNEPNYQAKAAILEAIGRCGQEAELKYLATVAPYGLKDSILLQAKSLALFRLAARGIIHAEGTNKLINEFIANSQMYPPARLAAANYLARAASIEVANFETALINAVNTEKDSNTLMFLVLGLAKTKTPTALATLKNLYQTNNCGQVKINIIRSLRYFPYDSSKTLVFNAVADSIYPHLGLVAAEQLYHTGKDLDALLYSNLAATASHWRTQYQLYAAAIHNLAIYKTPQRNFISQKLISIYPTASSDYHKAAIIKALSEHVWNYKFIAKLMFPPATDSLQPSPVVLSASAEALVAIRSNPDFDKIVGLNKLAVVNELNAIFRLCIERGDVGVQALVAEMFCNPKLDFIAAFPDYNFIAEAQTKLKLPRDLETYIFMQKASYYFAKTPTRTVQYHQLLKLVEPDWQVIKTISNKDKALISTNKGDIIIKLLYQDAPATVSHFIQLAQSRFYDNKTFHRVVANFVVQGGCPRGDGYGGFDYGTPTEISSRRFDKAGMVGMASAGKDTESSQFFITHAPALHLDGNYTVFAEVEKGINVVQRLEIGDTIRLVKLID